MNEHPNVYVNAQVVVRLQPFDVPTSAYDDNGKPINLDTLTSGALDLLVEKWIGDVYDAAGIAMYWRLERP